MNSCKRSFYEILGSIKVTDEVLITTICLVAFSLRACLLTPVSDDPDSLDPLTRNHFPIAQHSLTFLSLGSSENYFRSNRYARGQAYANATWQRMVT